MGSGARQSCGRATVTVAFGDAEGTIGGQAQDTILLDMIPPWGEVVVMAGEGTRTQGPQRRLVIFAQDEGSAVDAMRLGSQSNLDAVVWETYKGFYDWNFAASATVYTQFRDRAGSVSPIYLTTLQDEKAIWLIDLPLVARSRNQ